VDKNAGLPEFNVKFTQLNYGSCVALASEEFGSDLYKVDVNGIEQSSGPMLKVKAGPACAKGTAGSIVYWTFF
jgi:hypothetical protein